MSKATDDALLWPQHNKTNNSDLFSFPSEFPYEFGIPSPVESVAGSTETDTSNDDEEFFAALTRRLSQSSLHDFRKHHPLTSPIITNNETENVKLKKQDIATSPQSTLSGIGSWSGRSGGSGDGSPNGSSRVPSPLTTPFVEKNDPFEAIYAVAGEVARLKNINSETMSFGFQNRFQLGLPHASTTMFPNHASRMREEHALKQQCGDSVWGRQQVKHNLLVQQQQLQVQNRGYESVKCTRPSLPQSAWPPQCTGSGSRLSGSGVKKGCSGTGVFLPRHHVNNPSETRKKPGFAPVVVPAKVVHALNLTSQSQLSNAFALDYDALLASRNALFMQKQRLSLRREEVASYETRLPQEWTY